MAQRLTYTKQELINMDGKHNSLLFTTESGEVLKKLNLFQEQTDKGKAVGTKRTTPQLKIIVINFHGIMHVRELLSVMLEDIDPDIVIGTETWLNPTIKNSEFLPEDFNLYRRDRTENSWGGALIAVKKNITSEEIKSDDNAECIFCKIKPNPKQSLVIGSVYRKPDNNLEKSTKMCEIMYDIVSRHTNADILIGGDFNLPDINWVSEEITRYQYKRDINQVFLNTTLDLGLHQMVHENTRLKAILDLLFTNQPNLIQKVKVEPGLSDHDIVLVEYKVKLHRQKKQKRKLFLWKHANIDSMKNEINEFYHLFMQNHRETEDINKLWEYIKTNMLTILNENVPTKFTTRNPGKPWINTELKRTLRKKKRWFKKYKACPSESIKEKYQDLKREAQKQCREAYVNYVNSAIMDDHSNCKKFWAYIKSKNKEVNGVVPLINKNGTIAREAVEKANALNEQFSSVFSDADGTFSGKLPKKIEDKMDHIQITEEGISKLLSNLCETKATGPDNISAKFLKTFATELAPVYRFLFQTSLDQCKVPDDWKEANITPIFKKGERNKPENYRPVSITSISCKMLEHILCSNISRHLDQNNILTDAQHGFRRHRSCETQLITTCDDFVNTINEKGQTDAVLLDFSKAFDKVHHQSLLVKLENYGIANNTHKWISSFLTNRSQKVMVDNALSSALPVLSGVPQGSVLGPLLFLIYINDMPDVVSQGSKLKLFADDSLLYREVKSPTDADILQKDLNALQEWERDWRMEFHPKKCQVISITNKRKPLHMNYTIHGESLERTTKACYLGVTLDEKLTWNQHINKICQKANQKLGFLKRNLRNCPKDAKEKAYKAFVRPTLDYSACVWDPHTQKNIKQVELIQRRAYRFVNNIKGNSASITSLMEQNKWSPLKERRARQKLNMLYKAQQGQAAVPTTSLKKHKRKEKIYQLPYSRVDAHLHSFFPDTARLWNSLPESVRVTQGFEKFKIDTKDFLFRPVNT